MRENPTSSTRRRFLEIAGAVAAAALTGCQTITSSNEPPVTSGEIQPESIESRGEIPARITQMQARVERLPDLDEHVSSVTRRFDISINGANIEHQGPAVETDERVFLVPRTPLTLMNYDIPLADGGAVIGSGPDETPSLPGRQTNIHRLHPDGKYEFVELFTGTNGGYINTIDILPSGELAVVMGPDRYINVAFSERDRLFTSTLNKYGHSKILIGEDDEWKSIELPLGDGSEKTKEFTGFVALDSETYIASSQDGVFITEDRGETWSDITPNIDLGEPVRSYIVSRETAKERGNPQAALKLLVIPETESTYTRNIMELRSDNGGQNWTVIRQMTSGKQLRDTYYDTGRDQVTEIPWSLSNPITGTTPNTVHDELYDPANTAQGEIHLTANPPYQQGTSQQVGTFKVSYKVFGLNHGDISTSPDGKYAAFTLDDTDNRTNAGTGYNAFIARYNDDGSIETKAIKLNTIYPHFVRIVGDKLVIWGNYSDQETRRSTDGRPCMSIKIEDIFNDSDLAEE